MEELSNERGKNSSLFLERLPKKPYCMDGKQQGIKIRTKAKACEKPLIQYNDPRKVSWLCFDIDRERAHEAYFDANLPTPSLTVINAANGHAHVYYGLVTPVHRLDCARLKPLKLLAALEHGLRQALGADEGHTGLIGKTPHHTDWRTLEPNFEALYDLNELAEYVELPAKMPRRLGIRHGIGRNVELFDQLRFWAYKWKADFKAKKTQEQWNTAVLSRALDYNNFAIPLGLREVEGIAKSVAKWVWAKYTGRMSDADFSSIQSKRGQRKGAKIKQALAAEL
jgi:hypothetical protein